MGAEGGTATRRYGFIAGIAFGILLSLLSYAIVVAISVFEYHLLLPPYTASKLAVIASAWLFPFVVVAILRFVLMGRGRIRFLCGLLVVLLIDTAIVYYALLLMSQSVGS